MYQMSPAQFLVHVMLSHYKPSTPPLPNKNFGIYIHAYIHTYTHTLVMCLSTNGERAKRLYYFYMNDFDF